MSHCALNFMPDHVHDNSLASHQHNYIYKYISINYALGSAHEKFDVWNDVASQSHFPYRPQKLNSWVDPNWT